MTYTSLDLLFYMFINPETDNAEYGSPIANIGNDLVPFAVSWRDAGECFRCALEIDFDRSALEVRGLLRIPRPSTPEIHWRKGAADIRLGAAGRPVEVLEEEAGVLRAGGPD